MRGLFYLQSSYTMLKSSISVANLVSHAKNSGYNFVALSDNNNMHGFVELYQECKKNNLMPVFGIEINVRHNISNICFLVYAKNKQGFTNLLSLSTKAMIAKELMSLQELICLSQGLLMILVSYENVSESQLIEVTNVMQKEKLVLFIGMETFKESIVRTQTLAKKLGIKTLPVHQTLYLTKDLAETGRVLSNLREEKHLTDNAHFIDYSEIIKSFDQETLSNLKDLKSDLIFEYQKPLISLPRFPLDNIDVTSQAYLSALAKIGLKKRLVKSISKPEIDYQERLLYELNIIHQMGFSDYFLIVYDFVRFAKENDVLVGPGRGSAAGSLVSYVLGITEIDPLKYDLLFERFLNPERQSMPDIDLDFPDDKRNFVINYVKKKYGINHIASITTFNTLGKRSAIRDIARMRKLSSTRATAIINSLEKNQFDESDVELLDVIQMAASLEGLPRQTGTHAAGIVLANENLSQIIPLQNGSYDFYQSQLEAKDLEWLGLLKMDFLGIKNLTIIYNILQSLKIKNIHIDLSNLSLDDENTYSLLRKADTSGIFQLESAGMRGVLEKLEPCIFSDLYDVLALYRPGPMGSIDEFIARKNGKKYKLVHPEIDGILKATNGIILYQEQIMEIANKYAGYSYAEADILRRGMAKKDFALLKTEESNFLLKCKSKNRDLKVSQEIYDFIVKFADYGFNKSHSVAYALISYQMAYLKANYYKEFMLELLSTVLGSVNQVQTYLNEMRSNGVSIKGPSVNISSNVFITYNDEVYFPLTGITGITKALFTKIEAIRANEPFKTFDDFKIRTKQILTDDNLKNIIYSGALDEFEKRERLIANMTFSTAGYENYFEDYIGSEVTTLTLTDYTFQEEQAIGFNLIYNPFNIFKDYMQKNKVKTISEFEKNPSGKVLAYVKDKREIVTKKGDKMAFLTISDNASDLECVLFPRDYQKFMTLLDSEIKIFYLKQSDQKGKNYIISSIKLIQ